MLADRLNEATGRGRYQFARYLTHRNLSSVARATYYYEYDTWDYPITGGNRAVILHPSEPPLFYSRMAGDPYEVVAPSRYVGPPIGRIDIGPRRGMERHYSSPSSGSSSISVEIENETIGQSRSRTNPHQNYSVELLPSDEEENLFDFMEAMETSDESELEGTNLQQALRSLRQLEATTDKSDERANNKSNEDEETSQCGKKKFSMPKTTNEDIPPNFRWIEIEIV